MPISDRKAIIRTKIVATLGPATADPKRLAAVLDAGVDVCRLNFSHGSYEDHRASLENIRAWSEKYDRAIAVLGDLCGPKIRLNRVLGDAFELKVGDPVRFVRGDGDCTPENFTISYSKFVDEVQAGQRVFIDDGMVRLLVTVAESDEVICTCTTGGVVSSRKGVNLPDTTLSAPALTDKDYRDLDWAIENRLDYVALSFVRKPEDLRELRARIDSRDARLGVIVKIEKPEALEHLDALIEGADGVMVARGDLGVEMDVWRVPLIQKDIVTRCRAAGKPVIIATQMLQTMIVNPTPTRAEVSDIANAILDQADAIMLSGETAAGKYPDLAVAMMDSVARATESYQQESGVHQAAQAKGQSGNVASAIACAAVQAALNTNARLVAVWSASGETARLVAQQRLPVSVIGLTYDEQVYRSMNLFYGVTPLRVKPMSHPADMADVLDAKLVERNLARYGDTIIVVTSTHPKTPGGTNTVLVHRVGEKL